MIELFGVYLQTRTKSRHINGDEFKKFEVCFTFCFHLGLVSTSTVLIIIIIVSFSHQRQLMIFPWSLTGSKSPQVSKTLLSILADLNNGWSPLVLLFLYQYLVTITISLITIGINVTFMFHRFFQLSTKFKILILLFTFFQLYSMVSCNSKVYNSASSLI